MRKTIIILTILAGGLFFGGCNSWLDVKPYDSMAEDQLYSTENGIQRALNGLYLSLASNDLYAENLGGGAIDVLGQRYKLSSGHTYYDLNEYNYTNDGPKGTFEAIWKAAYKLIADCNEFLEKVPEHQDLMSQANYRMSMGEALAIRTLLHFDMFRIFGPVYSEANKKESSIPYYNMVTDVTQPILPADELVEHLFADIDSAIVLLSEDVILTEGIVKDEDFWDYRNLRLNYYAVQALMARVALYCGEKDVAWEYADKMIRGIREEHEWFPFATREEIVTTNREDRIFQSEILFGLYNLKRKESVYEVGFGSGLKQGSVLRIDKDIMRDMYEGDDNDYRLSYWFAEMVDPDNNSYLHVIKYKEVDDVDPVTKISKGYSYIMPILRVSEVYLIAAECCPDPKEGRNYLNAVRTARNVKNIQDDADLTTCVEQEYKREFVGEGQLFWLYKRKGKSEIASGEKLAEVISMEERFYLFDLPQTEQDYRKENGVDN